MALGEVRGFVDTTPSRFRHWSVAAFGVWNVVVWVSRIRNVVLDGSLSSGSRVAWSVPAVLFVVAGIVAGVAWWRGPVALLLPLRVFSGMVLLYWLVRLPISLFGHHSGAFKVVHTVLAVGSMAVATAVLRRLLRSGMIPAGAYR